MKKSKIMISILLTAVMVFSLFTIVPMASAEDNPDLTGIAGAIDTAALSEKPPAYDPDSATVGQYSINQVETSLLVRHTGRTSELLDKANSVRDAADPSNYTAEEYDENFISLTCDEDFYNDLDFDASTLKSNAKSYAADPDCQNPLSGFAYTDPKEMIVGQCNGRKDFETYIDTFNNQEINDPRELDAVLGNNEQNTDEVYFHDEDDSWRVQFSNGIGLDADGDGTDEFAYYSLVEKKNDNNNQHSGSYIRVQLYDRVKSGDSYIWSKVREYTVVMDYDKYVYGCIPEQESAGYVSLAAGDYDGDGKEELAYYMPDRGGDQEYYSADARVVIEKFDPENNWANSNLAQIYLKDINADYGKMGGSEYMYETSALPTVSLSTTSTRLKEIVNLNPDTNSAKRYSTYDDLVISVSVPAVYFKNSLTMNSTTAIYGLKDGGINSLFSYEYKPFNAVCGDEYDEYTRRMSGVSTCDADLNGDGFKELVAAGWMSIIDFKQYEPVDSNPDHQGSRVMSKTATVDIISYKPGVDNPSNGQYETLWEQPKVLEQPDQNIFGATIFDPFPPIAVCAGRYTTDSPEPKEQVCINGVVYDLANTLISGKPLYYCYQADGTQTNYITDTLPGYDALNFPFSDDSETGAKGVVFDQLFVFNPQEAGLTCERACIQSCVSGRFFTDSAVDQIAIVSWDYGDYGDVYMDLSIVSDTASSGWSYQTYNDIVHDRNFETGGTSLFTALLDVEEDSAVYRWMGSYCSYSAPSPVAILQAPPYYREANSMYTYEFGIVHGNTSDSSEEYSVGGSVAVDGKLEIMKDTFSVGLGGEFGGAYVNNSSWSKESTIEKSFTLVPGQDTVVCQVTPIIINVYEVYQTKPSDEELAASDEAYASGSEENKLSRDVYQTCTQQDPIYTSLSLTKYNEAVSKAKDSYQENDVTLAPEKGAPIIDPDILPKSSGGDPAAYNHTYNGAFENISYDHSSTKCGELEADVYNSDTTEMVASSFEFGYGSSNETGYELHGGLHVKVGFKIKRFEFDGEIGPEGEYVKTSGSGTMDGTTFLATYYTPRAEQQILGDLTYAEKESYSLQQMPAIVHYDPENGTWYNYRAMADCYNFAQYYDDDGNSQDVMALSFYTVMTQDQQEDDHAVMINGDYVENPTPAQINYLYPPEPPEEFTVQSMAYNADDQGSLDVTLVWKSENRNITRKADGYNIYMCDANPNEKNKIHLLNKSGLIYPSQSSAYTTASFHLTQGNYAESDISFYIVPAYLKDANGAQTVTEGTISDRTTIADPYAGGKGMVITKQPKTYWMRNDDQNETAVFTIEAVKSDDFLSTENVRFFWQEYNQEEGEWETVHIGITKDTGSDSEDPQVFKSSYTVDVDGAKKAEYVDKGIRCLVSCGNTTKTSDLVSFYYLSDNQYILGDADGDRAVTSIDTTFIQRDTAMMNMPDYYDKVAADADGDGVVSVLDATWIQRDLANMNTPYDIGGVFRRPD